MSFFFLYNITTPIIYYPCKINSSQQKYTSIQSKIIFSSIWNQLQNLPPRIYFITVSSEGSRFFFFKKREKTKQQKKLYKSSAISPTKEKYQIYKKSNNPEEIQRRSLESRREDSHRSPQQKKKTLSGSSWTGTETPKTKTAIKNNASTRVHFRSVSEEPEQVERLPII